MKLEVRAQLCRFGRIGWIHRHGIRRRVAQFERNRLSILHLRDRVAIIVHLGLQYRRARRVEFWFTIFDHWLLCHHIINGDTIY